MATRDRLGIWMNHSIAHLIEFNTDTFESKSIESTNTIYIEEDSILKNEQNANSKGQAQLSAYYKKICDVIKDYEEVILFGPTNAKAELFYILKADHLFNKIKIIMKGAVKINDHQQSALA